MKYILIPLLTIILTTGAAWASHQDTSTEIENLKERIHTLESKNGIETTDSGPFTLHAGDRTLSFSGLIKVEADYSKSKGTDAVSDLKLATLQLSAEAQLNKQVGGHVILLYEEEGGDDALKVDEAVITLHLPQHLLGQDPTLDLGKLYLPFGKFNSAMISDPLTLDLGETQNSAAVFGLGGDLWSLRVGLFNGETEQNDDTIDSFVAAFEITPVAGVSFGASYLSDLAESGAGLVADPILYDSSVAAASAFASLAFGGVGLEGEIVTALTDFDTALIGLPDTDLTGKRPLAWQTQLSWRPSEVLQLAARVEGAKDYQDEITRYGATVSYGLTKGAVIAMEYLYSDFADDLKNQTVTAQLAMEF
ncbi:MAG: LbtU family siderophore porin [Desulfuromonadales bacterium]|nr:LbtU family siderophore porin [Desulfuromonadales bacterium]